MRLVRASVLEEGVTCHQLLEIGHNPRLIKGFVIALHWVRQWPRLALSTSSCDGLARSDYLVAVVPGPECPGWKVSAAFPA